MSDRLERLFNASHDGTCTPLADKRLWTAALGAARDLTLLELRCCLLLTDWHDWHAGGAWPSIQSVADALGINKRLADRVLKSIVRKGWYSVAPGGRGRGRCNTYVPNPEKVSSEAPFKDAMLMHRHGREQKEKVPLRCKAESGKGASQVPKSPEKAPVEAPNTFNFIRTLKERDTVRASPAPCSHHNPGSHQEVNKPETNQPALEQDGDRRRRRREPDGSWITRERQDRGLSADDIGTLLNLTARQIEDIEDEHSHLSPSQRRKLRRFFEVNPPPPKRPWRKPSYVAARSNGEMTEEEFYRRRAQMIAELEAMDTSERKAS